MRLIRVVGLVGIAVAVACEPSADEAMVESASGTPEAPPAAAQAGEVRGVVRDAATERPLQGAWIASGDLGADTDASGAYALRLVAPGPAKLRAYHRGFRAESVTVIVRAGDAAVADVNLAPAAPPCCRLSGEWTISFALDSTGLNARSSTRRLSGAVTFAATEAPAADERAEGPEVRSATAEGRASFDFAPLLGTRSDARVEELAGVVFAGDSVAITLIPRFGDWAIELLGRQDADTIRGDWFQRASCCGAYGTFVMTRIAASP